MTKTLERKIIETAERDISKTNGDVDMAIKKYVIKYRSTPTSEWEILRNSGSVITTAENETDAKEWAICELADRLQSKARKNARDKANEIRCYELADQYPDWHEFYKQVKEYDWLIED